MTHISTIFLILLVLPPLIVHVATTDTVTSISTTDLCAMNSFDFNFSALVNKEIKSAVSASDSQGTTYTYYFTLCNTSKTCYDLGLKNSTFCAVSSKNESYPLADIVPNSQDTQFQLEFFGYSKKYNTTLKNCPNQSSRSSIIYLICQESGISTPNVTVNEVSTCNYNITITVSGCARVSNITSGCGSLINKDYSSLANVVYGYKEMITDNNDLKPAFNYFSICSSPMVCQRPEFGNVLPQSCTYFNGKWTRGGLLNTTAWKLDDDISQVVYGKAPCSKGTTLGKTTIIFYCEKNQIISVIHDNCNTIINFGTPLACPISSCLFPVNITHSVDLSMFIDTLYVFAVDLPGLSMYNAINFCQRVVSFFYINQTYYLPSPFSFVHDLGHPQIEFEPLQYNRIEVFGNYLVEIQFDLKTIRIFFEKNIVWFPYSDDILSLSSFGTPLPMKIVENDNSFVTI